MAVMTDPMPGTGAIIPHVVEVEARDDVRVVVESGPWPLDPALRAGGAAHLAALRRRAPGMHDGPVLAMTAVDGGIVRARRAGYFDMVATADALAGDPGLRDRAVALAGADPRHRGDGRAAAIGLSVAALVPGGRVLLGRRRADLPLDPGRWHVVPSGMLEPEPDPVAAAVVREAREELGVDVDPAAVRMLGLGWDLARLRPEVCVALALEAVPARAGGDEFADVRAFALADAPAEITPGAACALSLLSGRTFRGTGPDGRERR
jgi:8-oxo-dGTP pyrophosphatase MutT (NUDIX family)